MTKNLCMLLAGALGLLVGCVSSPISSFGSSASKGASNSASSQAPKSSAAPDAITSPNVPFSLNDSVGNSQNPASEPNLREVERGGASWYGARFHGQRTANGERYDQHALTAAHKTLPFGTLVRVRSLVTGKEVDVRVTDRGPFGRGRIIDVSRAAAEALGMLGLGVKQVSLHIVE